MVRLFAHEIEAYRRAETRAERTAVIEQAAMMRRCSTDAIYRAMKTAGAAPGRKKRADAGGAAAKVPVAAETLEKIFGLIVKSRGGKGRYEMTAKNAVRVAEETGWIEKGAMSAATFRRWLSEQGKSKEHLERRAKRPAHVNMKTERPNQLWQFDASACRQQFMYPDGRWVIEDNAVIYANKPEKVRRAYDGKVCRFIRYITVDHCSGLCLVKYDLAPSEEQLAACCVLAEHMAERGVPERLMSDQGLLGKPETPSIVRFFLEALGVECITHTPGKPNAKGSVESTHYAWEQYFESRLICAPARELADLKQRAAHHQHLFNSEEKHDRHGRTREAVFAELSAEARRTAPPPEVCWDLMIARPEERIVGEDLGINFHGKLWRAGDANLRGRKVWVRPSAEAADEIYVSEPQAPATFHVAKFVARDIHGFAEDAADLRHPRTPVSDEFLKMVEARKQENAEAAIAACAGPAAMTGPRIVRGNFVPPAAGRQEKDGSRQDAGGTKENAGETPALRLPAGETPAVLPPQKLIAAMDARSRVLDELAPLAAAEKTDLDALLGAGGAGGEINETKLRAWIAAVHAARAAEYQRQDRKQA